MNLFTVLATFVSFAHAEFFKPGETQFEEEKRQRSWERILKNWDTVDNDGKISLAEWNNFRCMRIYKANTTKCNRQQERDRRVFEWIAKAHDDGDQNEFITWDDIKTKFGQKWHNEEECYLPAKVPEATAPALTSLFES